MEQWLKRQINEAHVLLDAMGVPDRERRTDPRTMEKDKEFSLGLSERLQWLRANWQPKTKT